MARLLVIGVASLISFFVLFVILTWVTQSSNVAAWTALVLGFIGTPILLLRVWPGQNLSSKCPGGKGLYPECLFVVTIGESVISVQCPDGSVSDMQVSDLQEVAIVTNDSGPAGADVWWVLSDKSATTKCIFPGGATGEQEALKFVQRLPGFNNKRFIQAMGCTRNAKFVCWSAAG